MKKVLATLFLASFAAGLLAQAPPARSGNRIVYFPSAHGGEKLVTKAGGVTYHGGPVLVVARVVFIFWGPSFANAASADHTYATTLQTFRNQFGTSAEYNVITQYYQIVGGVKQFIQLTNLGAGTADWFDTTTPPTKVTDAIVQNEVNAYLATHAVDYSTVYEVVLPSSSYSDDGTGATSCGGPNLAYCAYHSWFGTDPTAVKYSIQPYPSCSGCSVSGWSAVQNQEHFVTHETRETVTDPTGRGWFSSTGSELDDLCAWSPTPFLAGGFGYQYEWSNATSSCVKTR